MQKTFPQASLSGTLRRFPDYSWTMTFYDCDYDNPADHSGSVLG